jgi:hypothetical protein
VPFLAPGALARPFPAAGLNEGGAAPVPAIWFFSDPSCEFAAAARESAAWADALCESDCAACCSEVAAD